MTKRLPSLVTVAVVLYCAFNARELLEAWKGNHIEQYSWITLLIWLLPILLYWTVPSLFPKEPEPGSFILLVSALAISLGGVLGSLNVAQHIGLALSLAAFLPWSWKLVPWLITSISWMPALGWFAIYGMHGQLLLSRLLLAAAGTVWLIAAYGIHHQKKASL